MMSRAHRMSWPSRMLGTGLLTAALAAQTVRGPLREGQAVTLDFEGPHAEESALTNPFTDRRFDVVFEQSGQRIVVPGYFAADGEAADSGATSGVVWRVHFVPPRPGAWNWTIRFVQGPEVAIARSPAADATASALNGQSGKLFIKPKVPNSSDPLARGVLRRHADGSLRFANQPKLRFVKAGTDSPENLLGYELFDGTSITPQAEARRADAELHRFEPHIRDWRTNDPTWSGGRGKGLIGAINYLSSKGVNSVYMLTMNVEGDGGDVWPWTGSTERTRFDCSKLDQWNRVFAHLNARGVLLHLVLTETENESLFEHRDNGGSFAATRKLYYRELVARFAHHPMLVWNLGEENGSAAKPDAATSGVNRSNTDRQRREFAAWLRELDPQDHPIVVHTYPDRIRAIYEPLFGDPGFDGASVQIGSAIEQTHATIAKLRHDAAQAERPWWVCLDEVGPANEGLPPDAHAIESAAGNERRAKLRHHALWGALLAGAGGTEWYFGYRHPHNDLNCEDFRSRDGWWDQVGFATRFFAELLPAGTYQPHSALVTGADHAYCFAEPGKSYAIFCPHGAELTLDVQGYDGQFQLWWFDPVRGGDLQRGAVEVASAAAGAIHLGSPPRHPTADWVILVRR